MGNTFSMFSKQAIVLVIGFPVWYRFAVDLVTNDVTSR